MSSTSTTPPTEIDEGLFSRQLHAEGHQAVRSLLGSRVLLCGLGGLGLETAKCLVLSGVGTIVLWDSKTVTEYDLSANCYLSTTDLGRNRAEVSLPQLTELNPYVKVAWSNDKFEEFNLSEFTAVVMTDVHLSTQQMANERCRAAGTKLIAGQIRGLFAQLFVDFGPEFKVTDVNGERVVEAMIGSVTKGETTLLETIPTNPHKLADDTLVELKFEGSMEALSGTHRIKSLNTHKFTVDIDSREFDDYSGSGGSMVELKETVTGHHLPFAEAREKAEMAIVNLSHFERPPHVRTAFEAVDGYYTDHGQLPEPWNEAQMTEVVERAKKIDPDVEEEMPRLLAATSRGQLLPLAAAFGGFLAQEVKKACTGKQWPLSQWLFFEETDTLPKGFAPKSVTVGDRYTGQRVVFGDQFQEQLAKARIFVVGAGAIGCELLKNLAVVGAATADGGELAVTDMDTIEKSNLNRQFLFRNSDIGKAKSEAAGAAVLRMNPDLQLVAHVNRISQETADIYHAGFFADRIVMNALDNVEARRYVDGLCVAYGRPLLESGTLGTKGNTQTIVPRLTESYSSSHDPEDEQAIPMCTLRSFPNNPEHTIEWAKSLFAGLFEQGPTNVQRVLDDPEYLKTLDESEQIALVADLQRMLVDGRPESFTDALRFAHRYWVDNFRNGIMQLLHTMPPDHKTAEGAPFWSGSKRCPHPLEFEDRHLDTVFHFARLWAEMYGIEVDRPEAIDLKSVVGSFEVPEFVPSDGVKVAVEEKEAEQDAEAALESFDLTRELSKLPDLSRFSGLKLKVHDFEKDDDSNGHIDFIVSMANTRSENYGIKLLTAHEVKRIAGRIIPALITTTTTVAGLQTLELFKLVFGHEHVEAYTDSTVNLALPTFVQADPRDCAKMSLAGLKDFSFWTNLRFEKEPTLGELIEWLESEYQLSLTMLNHGETTLYLDFYSAENEHRRSMKLSEIWTEVKKGEKFPDREMVLGFDAEPVDEEAEELPADAVLPSITVPVGV